VGQFESDPEISRLVNCEDGANRFSSPSGPQRARLFRVTLRSQPRDLALSRHPFISIGLAYEALDVSNFRAGTVGLNLPIALGDSLAGKGNAR
jgi:hypothetical protein